ncbi:MAG TPA: class I SAM-dependent methyltransferase [Thermoleophilia bacterium]|nr:class I SAM-dependent methyltransferase [Thermoleophilia bacterium]
MTQTAHTHDVCSAEHAGWLSTPVRRLITDPRRILRGLVRPGDHVVDLGCGPGFFTLPLAAAVGEQGQVIAVDLQPAMLEKLRERASRQGVVERIRLHQCAAESLALDESSALDFALAFWMVHEVPDAPRFFREVAAVLRPGGSLLLVEPKGHVGSSEWAATLDAARAAGLVVVQPRRVALSRAALLEKTG